MNVKWIFSTPYDLSDENFSKIFDFYMIQSPIAGISRRGITFENRKCNLKSLYYAILRNAPSLKNNWFTGKATEIEKLVREHHIENSVNIPMEIAIHVKSYGGKTTGLFYAIRCAFAHGSFATYKFQDEKYYLFENRDSGTLKGRIVLTEKTLLSVIQSVEETSGRRGPGKRVKKK